MEAFQMVIHSQLDIAATLREGLRECGSLNASRKTWARLIEALGANVFRYLQREDGEAQPTLGDAAQAVVAEAVPVEGETDPRRAEVIICDGLLGFTTPNNVEIRLMSNMAQGLIVTVHFNRESKMLATMMLAGFARRLPSAWPLLAQASTELAALCK